MQPDHDRLRADLLKILNELYLYGFTSAKHQERDDEIEGITQGQALRDIQALIAREVRLGKIEELAVFEPDYAYSFHLTVSERIAGLGKELPNE